MNEIIIQVHADRKLSKKVVDIGNMQESGVTKLIFELDEDIVALGGNVYLITSYDGESHPHVLKDNSLEVDRSFTQRKKTETNIMVSTSEDTENPLDGVVWISNTLMLTVDKNNINIDSINEEELPPSLKIIYDDLLNLQKDLQEKKDNDYWRGQQGPKGDAGSVKFVVVKELPTENIEENVMYLVQVESEEENNKFLEYIYVDGSWECVSSASVEVNLDDYVKNTDYAGNNTMFGLVTGNPTFGINIENGKMYVQRAVEEEIDKKESAYKTITPSKLDYAVMKALSDSKLEWTDEQKQLARTLLGTIGSSDLATKDMAGLVRIMSDYGVMLISPSLGVLGVAQAEREHINSKSNSYRPLTPRHLDYAVKKALSDCKLSGDDAWTNEEKAKALEMLGGVAKVKVSSGMFLYGNNGNGDVQYVIRDDAKPWSIPRRKDGGVLFVGEPTEDAHATTKKYVDNLVSQHDIITSASGEVVTTTDSAKAKPKNIKLFGKSKQDGTPSMETPIAPVHHGESGSIAGKVLTKNHFDIAKALDSNNWQLGIGLYSHFIIKGLQANTAYTFSFAKNEFAGEEYYVTITNSASSLDWENGSLVHSSRAYIKTKRTITASSDGCLYLHMYEVKNENLETLFAKCTEPQLELGTSRTTYEPYTEQPFTALTPNGLRGIPLGQTIPDAIKNSPIHMNGVYWDSVEGQYYIGDYKDYKNGKNVQVIGKHIEKGTSAFSRSGYSTTNYNAYYTDDAIPIMDTNNKLNEPVLSTHSRTKEGGPYQDCVGIVAGLNNKLFYYFVPANEFPDVETFTTFVKEQYNGGEPITNYFILAEPIITDTTDQYDVVMNYPNTTIVNDAGAYMEVEYVADTQKHIEQNYVAKSELEDIKSQMAEIQQVITNL